MFQPIATHWSPAEVIGDGGRKVGQADLHIPAVDQLQVEAERVIQSVR